MKRGDLMIVAMSGQYGKPRPAIVIQTAGAGDLETVTFLPLSSEVGSEEVFRVTVSPTPQNGLRKPSQIMVDKCSTLPIRKAGPVIGRLSPEDMSAVNRALAIFLGIV